MKKKLLVLLLGMLVCACAGVTVCFAATAPNYSALASTYKAQTKLANPPVVVADVTSSAVYSALGSEKSPATAIFHINKRMEVVNSENVKIASFTDAFSKIGGKVIPALYINSADEGTAAKNFITTNKLNDTLLISSNIALIKSLRTTLTSTRSAIDFSKNAKITAKEIKDITNTNDSKIAILSSSQATFETIDYLQRRLITVWVQVDGSLENTTSIVSRGVNGLVTTNVSTSYGVIESFTDKALQRVPYMSAHRGLSSLYIENSLLAATEAYKHGTDVLECDVYITTDDVPVIMHDNWMVGGHCEYTDANGDILPVAAATSIESKTSKEVTSWRFVYDPSQTVPTMEDFFKEFQNKDTIHFIEIKTTKTNKAIPLMKKLIEKYNMTDKIVFIVFGNNANLETQMREIRATMPTISLGYLTDGESMSILPKLAQLNATYNPKAGSSFTTKMMSDMADRGITCWPWTYNAAKSFSNAIMDGVYGLTTNYIQWGMPMVERLVAPDSVTIGNSEKNATELVGKAFTKSDIENKGKSVQCSYKLISGDIAISESNGKFYATNRGTGIIQLVYNVSFKVGREPEIEEVKYQILSDIVAVDVSTKVDPIPDPPIVTPDPPKKASCGGSAMTSGGIMGALMAIVGLCFCIAPSKNKRKASKINGSIS